MEKAHSHNQPKTATDIMARIGIAIQGPLVSRGRTGVTSQIKRHKLTEDDVIDFDCIDNIQRLYEAHPAFGKIVCVLWSDEPESSIQRLQRTIGADNIRIIDDDTRALRPKSGVLPGNNKYRQFLSSCKGVATLASYECEYSIKVRSDQFLDLYKLAQDLETISAQRNEFMMVPRMHSGSSLDHLADFYIGGRTDTLLECFETYLKSDELFKNIHTDIFYQWAALSIGKSPYPPRLLGIKANPRYVRRAWNDFFCPASLSVFDSLQWRGEKTTYNRCKNVFLEDLPLDLKVSKAFLK